MNSQPRNERPTVRAPDSADDRLVSARYAADNAQRRAREQHRANVQALIQDLSMALAVREQCLEFVRNPGRDEKLARLALVMAEES